LPNGNNPSARKRDAVRLAGMCDSDQLGAALGKTVKNGKHRTDVRFRRGSDAR